MVRVNSKNFDVMFKNLLTNKRGENIITGRFDIELVNIEKKIDFIIQFFVSSKLLKCAIALLVRACSLNTAEKKTKVDDFKDKVKR